MMQGIKVATWGCGQNPGHFNAEMKLWHHVIQKNRFMPHLYCIAN